MENPDPVCSSMNSALSTQDSGLNSLAEWLGYLEQLHPKTIDLSLDRVAEVKQRLNLSPSFPIITVAGTNGKGSVCTMLEAVLLAAGYRVGLYTSPHLLRYNERVRINGEEVSDDAMCAAFAAVEQARGDVSLTYFEFGTLAAVWLFACAGLDVAILEVGLGGRLDAVNAFDTDCAVLTSVDFDHMEYLGDSRLAIGYEKAGIFRAGKPAVCGEFDVPYSVLAHAEKIGANLRRIGPDFGYDGLEPNQWRFTSSDGLRLSLPYPALRGDYQLGNASTCLAALEQLRARLPVAHDDIRRGLLEAVVPGRFQVLPGRPQRIFDVAHNPHAARALAENLRAMPPTGKVIAVFAMLRDKDIAGVVRVMKEQVDLWWVAGIGQPRGASADELMRVLEQEDLAQRAESFPTVAEAYRHACAKAAEDDKILVFGSFYTVAEAMILTAVEG
ncbi:FolC bifunctional protein [Sulfuricella denitrificans skB26]|uniref:Dihydrofolate synthase/folylpolyglutamate synthase n=2 Tax=Sulfuricella denitrificans TaxID=649841 RepID=S6B258_SULDS|nr:FolC bifunctional protein [Sulfuricella denitrificans skB26]